MSLSNAVEDIIIDIIEKSRHPAVECTYDTLSRDRYTNKDFDLIFNEVLDIVEEADIDERRRDGETKIATISIMVIANFAEAEKFTDDLNDREYRKVEDMIDDYKELIDRLEGKSRRGRGRDRGRDRDRDDRDDRRSRGRRRSSRMDDDYSAGDRDARGGRRSPRDEGRRRKSGRGDEFRKGRNKSNEDEPKTLTQLRAEQIRNEANTEIVEPETPQQINRSRERNKRVEREERNYEFVGEEIPAVTAKLSKTEAELGFAYAEVPTGTVQDYEELGIDINDPEFIMTREIDKTDTYREIIYDPFLKQPMWILNDNGMRVLRFRDFNMNIDNHVIPDFTRSSNVPPRTINQKILPSLAQPSRRSILDISKEADKADRDYEEKLNEWEVNNKDRSPDEQEAKPEEPGKSVLGSHTLHVGESIVTSSLGDMIQETVAHFGQLRGFTTGHPPIESNGVIRNYAWIAESQEDRDDVMSKVEMFTTSHSHRAPGSNNVVPIHVYHQALMAALDTIPYGLWKRINRNMTQYCNDILTISLGLKLEITNFAEDGDKIVQYLNENYGQMIVEGFIIGHAQCGARISMLEAGKGEADLMIYEVKGTQVTVIPLTPDELTISSVKIEDGKKHGSPGLVTGESNLRLFNALRTIVTQSTPIMGKQTPYKYLAFSDGSVYRIDKNAMGLSGEHRRDTVEFLLTQMTYC